jgi:diacylglycerol kinase
VKCLSTSTYLFPHVGLDLAPSPSGGLPRFRRADPSTFLHKFILMNESQNYEQFCFSTIISPEVCKFIFSLALKKQLSSMIQFFQSLKNAWLGICSVALNERNFRIHLFFLFLAIGLGLFLEITCIDWLFIFLFSALVLALEAINSALEETCDLITNEKNESIRRIKDVAAGAVLIASIFAAISGIFIFGKYIF